VRDPAAAKGPEVFFAGFGAGLQHDPRAKLFSDFSSGTPMTDTSRTAGWPYKFKGDLLESS